MVLDSWRRPSGGKMSWFNLNYYLLSSFLTFQVLNWSRAIWPLLWDVLSYFLVLAACYWACFVTYRYLKRYHLAFNVASYKKAVLITGCDTGFGNMLARKLVSHGFQVLAGCLDPASSNATKLAEVHNVNVFPLDVTSEKSLHEALRVVSLQLESTGN
ncbi:17-beta-hydroxysteroid dehydrogenase type 6-like, partial [Tropilaelaps mercedesae]